MLSFVLTRIDSLIYCIYKHDLSIEFFFFKKKKKKKKKKAGDLSKKVLQVTI